MPASARVVGFFISATRLLLSRTLTKPPCVTTAYRCRGGSTVRQRIAAMVLSQLLHKMQIRPKSITGHKRVAYRFAANAAFPTPANTASFCGVCTRPQTTLR